MEKNKRKSAIGLRIYAQKLLMFMGERGVSTVCGGFYGVPTDFQKKKKTLAPSSGHWQLKISVRNGKCGVRSEKWSKRVRLTPEE